ncbi:MAG: thioesterase family protein [Nocardioides sp.]|nr:thioesterase family protein [Nocardioides sp.]
MGLAFFKAVGDTLVPQNLAKSLWSEDQMHGVALSGALAHTAEQALADLGREDLRPARLSVDMFRPARMLPCQLRSEVVREGPRIVLVDVTLLQEDTAVARAGVAFLKPGANTDGVVWSANDRPTPPPVETAPVGEEPHVPFFESDAGWSQNFAEHQSASRKATWQTGIPVVDGEPATPFTAAASIADATSMVCNWGSLGVEYINTDITLTLSRLPDGLQVGLRSRDRVENDGIAVGTATVFDRTGPIGTSVVTALANARRTVDFEQVTFLEDGSRESSPGV